MITFMFDENISRLKLDDYIEVYHNQHVKYQDYFHHPSFQYECLSVFKKYFKCFLLSVYSKNKLIGFMTFRLTTISVRKINYQFLVPGTFMVSEYNYPIISQNYFNDFFSILNKVFLNFNVNFAYVPSFFKDRILNSIKHSFVSRTTNNPILVNWNDEILRASKKSTPAKRKRQLQRKFDKVEIFHSENEIEEELLETFFELHSNRWKKEGISSYFNLREYREVFYKISSLKIDDVGYPVFSYIKVDGELLAMQLGYISNNKYIAQTIARTLNINYRSIGTVLIKEVLEYVSSKGIETYDFGLGLEKYKYRYINDILTYHNILKFKNPVYSFVNRINLK